MSDARERLYYRLRSAVYQDQLWNKKIHPPSWHDFKFYIYPCIWSEYLKDLSKSELEDFLSDLEKK